MSSLEPTTSLAHNISSAVFRVAELVKHKRLREELESAAISLVKDLNTASIHVLDRLTRLTEAVGQMNSTNTEVICRELGNLSDMLFQKEAAESEIDRDFSVEDMFLEAPEEKEAIVIPKIESDKESLPLPEVFEEQMASPVKGQTIQAGDRQAAILEFIRQFPSNCRMKDLTAEFSDFSERTLRTDVQKLIGAGLIERLGGKSGPSSYFKAVDAHSREGREEDNPDVTDTSLEAILLPENTAKF